MFVPMEGRIKVALHLYPPSKRRTDIDNYAKACLDVLVKCNILHDDSQIDMLHVERHDIVPRGRVEIHICQLQERMSPIS